MHKKWPSVSLVVPVYNNEKSIVSQLKHCNKLLGANASVYEIVIADDRSADQTAELLQKHFSTHKRFRIYNNKNNLGIAKNIFSLYKKARYEYVVFYSADGDWSPKDIKKLLDKAVRTGAAIVIGKRNKKRGYSFYRKIISYSYNLLPLILFGVNTIDAGSIKAIRRDIIKTTPLKAKSVFMDAEIIIRAKKRGYLITSCPVSYKKPRGTAGTAGNPSLILHSLADLLRLRMSRL